MLFRSSFRIKTSRIDKGVPVFLGTRSSELIEDDTAVDETDDILLCKHFQVPADRHVGHIQFFCQVLYRGSGIDLQGLYNALKPFIPVSRTILLKVLTKCLIVITIYVKIITYLDEM